MIKGKIILCNKTEQLTTIMFNLILNGAKQQRKVSYHYPATMVFGGNNSQNRTQNQF